MGLTLLVLDYLATLCGLVLIFVGLALHDRLGWLIRPNAARIMVGFVLLSLARQGMELVGVERGAMRLVGKVTVIAATLLVLRLSVPVAILVTGVVSNAIATAANGMVMPVMAFPGVEELFASTKSVKHVLADASTRALYLCDILPTYLGGKLVSVQSVGDVLINLGLVLLLCRVVRWFALQHRRTTT